MGEGVGYLVCILIFELEVWWVEVGFLCIYWLLLVCMVVVIVVWFFGVEFVVMIDIVLLLVSWWFVLVVREVFLCGESVG